MRLKDKRGVMRRGRVFLLLVLRHFLQKKIHRLKRCKQLAFLSILYYKRMRRLAFLIKPPPFFRNQRSIWALERREFWFSDLWERRDEDDPILQSQWKQDFRINKETFEMIVGLVTQNLAKEDTQLRRAIPIQKRVGIALWRLATGDSYRSVGKVFGVAKATAVSITHDFYEELSRIADRFIKFPVTRIETRAEILRFKAESNCKIPQAVGQ